MPSPFSSISLPVEIVLEILELAAAEDALSARSVAQVCHLARPFALKRAYTTLAPSNSGTASIWSLPEHLQPYVKNIWTKPAGGVTAQGVRTSWIWRCASHLAISLGILFSGVQDPDTAPDLQHTACTHLTLLGSDHSLRIGLGGPDPRHSSWFSALTHLRVRLDGPVLQLVHTFSLRLPALSHFALDAYYNDYYEHSLQCGFRLKFAKPDLFVVVVLEWVRRLGDFATQFQVAMTGMDVYLVPLVGMNASRFRQDWEREIDGGKDIWQKAFEIRDAVERNDRKVMRELGLPQ